MRICVIGFLCAALLACAPTAQNTRPYEEQALSSRARLDGAPICCSGWSEFSSWNSLRDRPTKYVIDGTAPATNFPGGRSRFVGFVLTPGDPLDVEIMSVLHMSGGAIGIVGNSFIPQALLLDEQFRPLPGPVLSATYDDKRRLRAGFFSDLQVRDPNARYLVIYTPYSHIGEWDNFEGMIGLPAAPVMQPYRTVRSAEGSLFIAAKRPK